MAAEQGLQDPFIRNQKVINTALSLCDEIANRAMGHDSVDPAQSKVATNPLDVISELKEVIEQAEALVKQREGTRHESKAVAWSDIVHLIDKPTPYVIWPVAVRGSMTQMQGLPKGGKSSFGLYLSVCGVTGLWPYPQYLRADTPLKILYLAWEDPDIMMSKRLSLYSRGLDLDKYFASPNLVFLFAPDIFVDSAQGEKNLREEIRHHKPDIVVIDTLSHIHQADENDASEMKTPMRVLDRITKEENIALIYLHHTRKGAEGVAQEKGRGSGAIAAAWHIMVDWGKREEGSNVNPIEVQSKFEHDWIKWAITYDARKDETGLIDSVKWDITSGDTIKADTKVTRVAMKFGKILETVRRLALTSPPDGWVTAHQVSNAANLGIEFQAMKNNLAKLCEDGHLEFKPGEKGGSPNLYRPMPKGNLSESYAANA